jgi:hypothetical protein
MKEMRLRESESQEMEAILHRAQEIWDEDQRLGDPEEQYRPLIDAAVESGMPRDAVVRAIRERLQLPSSPLAIGSDVFAQSVDGAYYVAQLESCDKSVACVRFHSGSRHQVPILAVKPFQLVPGLMFEAFFHDWNKWLPAQLVRYEPHCKMADVQFFDGERTTVSIHEIRLPRHRFHVRWRWWAWRILLGLCISLALYAIVHIFVRI